MNAAHRRTLIVAVAIAVAVAAGSMLLDPGAASATTLVHLSTRDLTLESSDIVIGKVESVRSYWNPGRTRILTDVDIVVSQTLAGAPAERLTLTQLGGEVDGVRVTVPGCPMFRLGEESLFFVWRDTRGRAQVNGLAQGKFDIQRDAATGARLVQRHTPGFGARDARTLAQVAPGQAAPRLRLEDLVREIRSALREKAADR